jgi:hypothetical protein
MTDEPSEPDESSYGTPLDELLTLGEVKSGHAWLDYLGKFDFYTLHIPELIRMATDPELNTADPGTGEVWAPLHAWRVLGQMRAVEAVEPLIALFDQYEEDDWLHEDLPEALGLIGPEALPALETHMADSSRAFRPRDSAARAILSIAEHHPKARTACVTALTRQLECQDNDAELNGFLIAYLIDLDAVESAPVMKKVFEADKVDISIVGDWDIVQMELGLKAPPPKPEPESDPSRFASRLQNLVRVRPDLRPEQVHRPGKADTSKKSKRRQEKQSRKKNRKKR